jgi:hypothetical protein
MGDSYRNALKANKAKLYPEGRGPRISLEEKTVVRTPDLRGEHLRESYKRHRKGVKTKKSRRRDLDG